jgi:UDP-N-acetylglucosamine:LPS N-acetylglucosamine transferase
MDTQKKILIPYFLAGGGHIIAAQSIAYYINKKKPEWDVRFLEPADEFEDKKLDQFYRQSWKLLLKRPLLSKFVHAAFGTSFPSVAQITNNIAIKDAIPKAIGILKSYEPDLIITTHFGCGHIFNAARAKGGHSIPMLYARNDLAGAFKIQDCHADIIFVTSDKAVEDFKNVGVQEERLKNVNFLVRPQFMERTLTKNEARAKINLPEDAYTILFTSGGEGLGFGALRSYVAEYLQITKEKKIEARIIIVTGKNEKLLSTLKTIYKIPEVVPLGYRTDMDILTAASDLVGGKFGAIYTMETLLMRKPFIGTLVGAPNEYHNKDFVVDNGYGWYAPTSKDFRAVLEDIFRNRNVIEQKIFNLSKLPSRNGAELIADAIIETLG